MTLKKFILSASILVSVIFFGGTYAVFSSIYGSSVKESAVQSSNTLAQLTFSSMFQIMSRGWEREQLIDFLEATDNAVADSSTSIDIYRGDIVTQLYGEIEQPAMDATIGRTFEMASSVKREMEGEIRYTFPLKAERKCLQCHTNAKSGDVLGVIDIRQNIKPFMDDAKKDFFVSLALISPVPFLVAFLVVLLVNRRIQRSINNLDSKVESVAKVSDLTTLTLDSARLGFKELDSIFDKIEHLAEKLRTVAVDKELLVFEIKLLEKFIITSEVVKDWRDYINRLLNDINKVIDAYTLFSIFKVDDELFDLEIFWLHKPSEKTKTMFEKAVREEIKANPHFAAIGSFNINHSVSDESVLLGDIPEDDIQVQVKSLFVEAPKIGGIVGIGVHTHIVRDETRLLVMESILSTLLNVVGSIKAIYKYTRDLEYYATRDPLTELYNQRLFWELVEYEIGRAGRHGYEFALLVIDLDNFKVVNDTYGHSFGDKFLAYFAEHLKGVVSREDIVCRYGGDEFVVIMPESNLEEAINLSERILKATGSMCLEAPDNSSVRGSVSIGISVFPEHAVEKKDLFLFADNMMYKAKSEGKSRTGIPTEDDVVEVFRALGEKSQIVLNAVEERKVIPHFQPIISTDDGEVEAVEVLSRIELEGDITLGANEFIELAEKMHLIHKLDYITMEKALHEVVNSGFEGRIFINLSPRALILKEFVKEVRRIVKESGVSPSRIVFEITERDTVKNIALMAQFINELKLEGFKLAIDDFGSGFSSFHYIKQFPIDYIKIEGEFISNMLIDPRDHAFVHSISRLAHQLRIQTVAEFVESEEVLEAVQDVGIDLAQGYFTGKPSRELKVGKINAQDSADNSGTNMK
ncbi:MAG: bifunctional diguanylate cyclase/phosphodiesterase [Pseudomonadota bacterium]